jgi:uncharacterized protein YggL (DUF469 family)
MNKRIKKKKYIYPFSEYGVELYAELKEQSDENNSIFYKFVDKIEELGLQCGGGATSKRIDLFICSVKEEFPNKEILDKMISWMNESGLYKKIDISEYKDAWFPDRKLHSGDKKKLKMP